MLALIPEHKPEPPEVPPPEDAGGETDPYGEFPEVINKKDFFLALRKVVADKRVDDSLRKITNPGHSLDGLDELFGFHPEEEK